jgi:hypothetical protein
MALAVKVKCVVEPQFAQNWISAAGSSLSSRLNPFVVPSMPTSEGWKYAQRAPDLLQSVQLHSLMKSGRFGISMRTWPQRQESFSILR